MADVVVALVVWAVPCLIALSRNWSHNEDFLREWQLAHGFQLTSEAQAATDRVLWTGRRLRTIGFIAGMGVPCLLRLVLPDRSHIAGDYVWWTAGYVVADVYAQRKLSVSPASGTAALDRRRVADYVPMWLVWVLRAAPFALAGLVAAYAAAPRHQRMLFPGADLPLYTQPRLGDISVAANVRGWVLQIVFVAAVVVTSEAVRRWIVLRPQSASSEEQRAIDDALRSDAVHRITGVAGFVVLNIVLSVFQGISNAADVPNYGVLGFLAIPFVFLAAGCVGYTNPLIGWRVRRRTYRSVSAPA